VSGLNPVLLICMGSSLGVDTICLGCNMGGDLNVGDGSQCFSCRCSKKSTIIMHNLHDCLTEDCGIKHGQWKVLHIFTESKLKLVHKRSLVP